MEPWVTCHAPSTNAAAAPSAVPRSVTPRVAMLAARVQNVLSANARARLASRSPQAVLCPNAFSVGSP